MRGLRLGCGAGCGRWCRRAAHDQCREADRDHRGDDQGEGAGHLRDHQHHRERGAGDAPEAGHHPDDHVRGWVVPRLGTTGSSRRQTAAPRNAPMTMPGAEDPAGATRANRQSGRAIRANGQDEHDPQRDVQELGPEACLDPAVAGPSTSGIASAMHPTISPPRAGRTQRGSGRRPNSPRCRRNPSRTADRTARRGCRSARTRSAASRR